MKRDNSASLKARYVPISKVSVLTMRRMYEIYSGYYENISLDLFCRDMAEKDGVFLVAERSTKRVVGFSTMKTLDMEVDGRIVRGVFSGDTILEKAYWGNKALHMAFFLRVIREKLRHPTRPLFWLLISKGYKTYLLMANNFLNYYPSPEQDCEKLASLVDRYCDELFREYYCAEKKLLDFGSGYTHLKSDVAGITDDMRQNNEKIQFFETRNPTWERGTELPCIGEVSYSLLLNYPLDLWRKSRRTDASVTAPVVANN